MRPAVLAARAEAPDEAAERITEARVAASHVPTASTTGQRSGAPWLLYLDEGIQLTSRTTQYAGVLPDRITICRQAICAVCGTEQEVADQVRRTVIHEVAHHFGIDDARLRELGW